jgi:hypothetical protein
MKSHFVIATNRSGRLMSVYAERLEREKRRIIPNVWALVNTEGERIKKFHTNNVDT